jgi:hypothetical protein
MSNLSSGAPTDQDGGDSVRRYYGDFSFESKNKVNEMIENIAKYPKRGNTLIPRSVQQKNPHTSGDAFFPGAS